MEINFKTSGICCREMNFSVDENNTITDVEFVGGCNGNLSGMAKLLIGQNALEVAEKLCDKIAIIKQGKIVVVGDTEEVKGNSSLEDVFMELIDNE